MRRPIPLIPPNHTAVLHNIGLSLLSRARLPTHRHKLLTQLKATPLLLSDLVQPFIFILLIAFRHRNFHSFLLKPNELPSREGGYPELTYPHAKDELYFLQHRF